MQRTKKIPKKISSWVQETFDEVGFVRAKVKFKKSLDEDWRDAARKLMLQLEAFDQTIIFILDELPAVLEIIARETVPIDISTLLASWSGFLPDSLTWYQSSRLETYISNASWRQPDAYWLNSIL